MTSDETLISLYEHALRDIAEILEACDDATALAALEIAADALTHRMDEMEAQSC